MSPFPTSGQVAILIARFSRLIGKAQCACSTVGVGGAWAYNRAVCPFVWRNHAGDRTQPLLRARERPRAVPALLLRGPRLRGNAAAELPVPGLLARGQRQDPGAYGPARHPKLGALLSRHHAPFLSLIH